MLKPKTAFLKFSGCIKICCQNGAEMCNIMVSSISGITYKNVTSGTRSGVREVFTVKTSLWLKRAIKILKLCSRLSYISIYLKLIKNNFCHAPLPLI